MGKVSLEYPITRKELAQLYQVSINFVTYMLDRIGIPKREKLMPNHIEKIKEKYGEP